MILKFKLNYSLDVLILINFRICLKYLGKCNYYLVGVKIQLHAH